MQHQDEDVLGPASVLALCDLLEISGLTFYSVLPLTFVFFVFFLDWFLVLFSSKQKVFNLGKTTTTKLWVSTSCYSDLSSVWP